MKPPPLLPGARVAVVAPAGAPPDPARLAAGLATLRARGLDVVQAREDYAPCGHLCGPDDVRLAELNGFLRREDVQAIFCVRGGFGTLRLLPHLDYDALRRHPKLIVGYSDITALLLAAYARAGVPGLAGPMVAPDWADPDPASEAAFWELAQGGTPQPLVAPDGSALVPVRPGAAEGTLLGGNLTLVSRLVGTPYLPDLTGAILYLEEVGEEPYRIDSLLAHLRLAGVLDRIGGLVVGGFTEWEPQHTRPYLPLEDVLAHYTGGLQVPVARGLAFGHFRVKNTLPVGVRGRLEVGSEGATLSVTEPVVA